MEEAEHCRIAHVDGHQGSHSSRSPAASGRSTTAGPEWALITAISRAGLRRGSIRSTRARSACAIPPSPTIAAGRGDLLRSVKVHESVINRVVERNRPLRADPTAANVRDHPAAAAGRERRTGGQPDPLCASSERQHLRSRCWTRACAPGCRTRRGPTAREARMRVRLGTSYGGAGSSISLPSAPRCLLLEPSAPGRRSFRVHPFCTDGRTWIGGVIRLLTIVLPGFDRPSGSRCMPTTRSTSCS